MTSIDPDVNWAGAYDVKRGNGPVDGRTRRPIEHDLKAARMVLPSYLAKRGYPNVTRVTAGIIDYYGATGFSKVMKIGRDDLDCTTFVQRMNDENPCGTVASCDIDSRRRWIFNAISHRRSNAYCCCR